MGKVEKIGYCGVHAGLALEVSLPAVCSGQVSHDGIAALMQKSGDLFRRNTEPNLLAELRENSDQRLGELAMRRGFDGLNPRGLPV